jgi:hypothetical protein
LASCQPDPKADFKCGPSFRPKSSWQFLLSELKYKLYLQSSILCSTSLSGSLVLHSRNLLELYLFQLENMFQNFVSGVITKTSFAVTYCLTADFYYITLFKYYFQSFRTMLLKFFNFIFLVLIYPRDGGRNIDLESVAKRLSYRTIESMQNPGDKNKLIEHLLVRKFAVILYRIRKSFNLIKTLCRKAHLIRFLSLC